MSLSRRFVVSIISLFALGSLVGVSFAEERAACPIIQLHGTPEQIGVEHAKELGATIKTLHEQYLTRLLGTATRRLMAIATAKAFEEKLSPPHLAELESLSRETKIDLDELMLGNCFLDVIPLSACSTIALPAEAAPDHVARFGRILDFPSLDIADKHSVVFVYHPTDGRYGFVSIGWPGIVGVLSGMNQHGLALANMEVSRGRRLPQAMPYTLLYRTVLEKCRTVDEAIELLSKTPIQTANNLMLMDAAGARAVVELSPEHVIVRRGSQGAALMSTNHQRGQDCDSAGRCRRYDSLHAAAERDFGQISLQQVRDMLIDVSPGNMTLQAMVFEPANGVIYLSTGKDAARGEYSKLDLHAWFK